ncbi:MAG: PKD domain-containing protein [Ginsengibacter sp.]
MRKAVCTICILFIGFYSSGQAITPSGTINICATQPPQVLSVTNGTAPYQWQKDGVNIPGATSVSYPASATGDYRVIINGGKKQGDTLGTVKVIVNPRPTAGFTFSPSGQCGNIPVNFINSSVGGTSYLWNFGDPDSGASNTSSAENPSHVFVGKPGNGTQSFNIKLITKTAAGCTDSLTKSITTKQVADGTLGGTGKGLFQGQYYFSICGDFASGDFTFSNQSSTLATNTSYQIVWGDQSPDFTSGPAFTSTVQHTYTRGTHKLLFIIAGQNGCVDTTTYYVFVGTNPAVGLANPGNTAVCSGLPLTFPIIGTDSNPPGTIYTVTFNDGSAPITYIHPDIPSSVTHQFEITSCGTNSSNGTNTYLNSFSASIVAANPCNSSAATIVPIYVSEKPKALFKVAPNDTICINNLLDLTNLSKSSSAYNGTCTDGSIIWSVSPATGWSINKGNLGNDYSSSNPSVWLTGSNDLSLRFTQPGVYTIKLKTGNAYCGISETTQTVCVNPAPAVSFALDKSTGCSPLTVSTNTTANLPTCGNNKFIWTVDYTAASGCGTTTGKYTYLNSTNSSSAEPVFQFNDPGVYKMGLMMVSPGGTCSTAVITKTVTVKSKPIVSVAGIPAVLCQFQAFTPEGTVSCFIDAATTYSWSFPGGSPVSSKSANPGKITFATPGKYDISLTVTNDCGDTTITTPVTVNPTPKITVPSDIMVCNGETIGPFNFVSDPVGATFSWTSDNETIGIALSGNSGIIPAFASINSTSAPISAIITVNAKIGDCSSSTIFKITVGARPEAPLVQNISYCKNDVALPLMATASPGNTLLWYTTVTGGTGSPTPPFPLTNIAGITTYYVSQVSTTTSCEGLRVPISIIVNSIPAIASASATGPTDCATATGSITLTGLSPSKSLAVFYTKDGVATNTNLNSTTSGIVIIPNLPAGTYNNIFVNYLGCPSNSVGPFTLADPHPPATPVITNNSPLCLGKTLTLGATTATPGQVSFNWKGPNGFSSTLQNPAITNVDATMGGTYYVSVSQNNCTSSTGSIPVIINALPSAPAVAPVNYCINTVASVLSAVGNSLLWFNNSSGGTGNTAAPIPPTNISGSTDYYVSQTDANGCESERAILNVMVHPDALAEFTPSPSLYCPPFNITPAVIGLHEYPEQNKQYNWYINGSFTGSGASFPGYTIPVANDSVKIKLITTSLFGCKSDTTDHPFYTYKLPRPSFDLFNNDGCGPIEVNVVNTTEDISLYNYEWDFGNGQKSQKVQPGIITFLTNPNYTDTTYYLKLKMLSVCDTLIVEKTVHVKSKPKALFTPDITTGCSPMKVLFKNTSKGLGTTYFWDFGDGQKQVTNTLADVQHTFYTSKVDTFYVMLIAINECGNDTISYAIIAAPNNIKLNFAMNGPDHFGCAPHTVAFINNTSGASSFQWDFGDGNFLSTSKNIDTVYHTYLISGMFTVSLKAQNNCTDTSTIDQIEVFPKPTAAFTASTTKVCISDQVAFSNQSSLATSYQWYFGDGTSSIMENPVHPYRSPGLYEVKLIVFKLNAPGSVCTDTSKQQIEVVASLPGLFSMDSNESECAPFTVTFINQNKPSVTATWDFGDGSGFSGDSTTHTYLYSGVYTVSLAVTVPGGCIYISKKTVTVKGPSGKLIYGGGYYCSPDNVRFEAIATNTDTYHWDFGDGNSLITTQPVVYHSYPNAGNYLPALSLQNNTGCNYMIKGFDTIKIDKIDAGYSFVQQNNCGSTDVIFTDTSHVFSGKNRVKWDFGDGTIAIGTIMPHTYTASGNYKVEMILISNSGCSDTVRKLINFHVNNKPVITISAGADACARLPVLFSGSLQSIDSLSILQWDLSNGIRATGSSLDYAFTEPGTYKVRFVAGTINGCYDTAFHSIVIKPSPVVKASSDVTLCKGNSAQLSVTGAPVYQWEPTQGLSCTTCANPVVFPEISNPYVVTGYNSIGCPGFDTVNVTVIPPLVLATSGNDSICIGQSANLLVSGADSYNWSPSTSLSNTTISNPVANPAVTTTYRVIGYDGHNCFNDTAFIVVAVGQYPTVQLGSDQTLAAGTLFPLSTTVQNGPVKHWLWTPATDLDCADCPLPVAHIKKDISYAVEITNAYGCKASDTISIKVFCKNSQVFIPNAFSPDGDGINDILMVRATGIVSVKSFRIFNRWGETVFEKYNFQPNEPSYGWDGRIRGKIGPPEVYVYTAEVLCENGVSFIYKGNTTILK